MTNPTPFTLRVFKTAHRFWNFSLVKPCRRSTLRAPPRYEGHWGNAQTTVEIAPGLYAAGTFQCHIDRVVEGPPENSETYRADMTCYVTDDPWRRKLRAVLGFREISGKSYLVIASHSTRFPTIDVLERERP